MCVLRIDKVSQNRLELKRIREYILRPFSYKQAVSQFDGRKIIKTTTACMHKYCWKTLKLTGI